MRTVDRGQWAVVFLMTLLAPLGVMGQTSVESSDVSISHKKGIRFEVSVTTIAADNAGNYGGGWTDGSNGGTGFSPWILNATSGSGSAGAFIGDPSFAGINGMAAESFGLYANPIGMGASVTATRPFASPLQVGQTFSVQWAVNWDSDDPSGRKGIILYAGGNDGTALVTIDMTNNSTIKLNESPMFVGFGTEAMTIHFERTDATSLRVHATGRDGSESYDQTIAISGAPDAIRFYASGLASGDQRQPYFNNLSITGPDPVDPPAAPTLATPADDATGIMPRATFTWNAADEADSYQFQISTSFGAFDDNLVVNTLGLTGTTVSPTSFLNMGTEYFWRVRAANEGGNGDWSDVRSFTTTSATMTMRGNGGGGFGNVIGDAYLRVAHDATHLYFELQKGEGNWNDVLTLYLDSKSGGFTSTTTLTDEADEHRKAASGYLSDVTFPTGFSADYAVTMDTDFAGLWTLSTGSFAAPLNLNATVPSNTTEYHTFRIAKSAITFDTENTFSIIGTYGNANTGFRSNNSFSIGLGFDNPDTDDITLRSFHNYPAGTISADVKFFDNAGWRFLANPFPGLTLNDYVAPLWTQGFTGSDSPNAGSSNVFLMNSSGAYESVANQTDAMTRGKGYVVGVYQDDNYNAEGAGSFPKTVTVTGTPNYDMVNPTLNGNNLYSLVGNPFPFAIDFDDLTRTNVSNIVYVYDYVNVTPSSPDTASGTVGIYRAWNGSAGSLTQGRIASFQSFLVRSSADGAQLDIEASDRTSPTLYFGKDVATRNVELVLSGDGLYSNAWLDISDNASAGLDTKDAPKLQTFELDRAVLYTTAEGRALDINHLPVSDVVELPLGIESTKSGRMTLNRGEWSLPPEWGVYVRDTQTGVVRELKEGIGMDVEPTRIARKATAELGVEVASVTAPRYTLIIDPAKTTSADRGPETVGLIELDQNYPNPFNPTTQIRFTLDAGRQTRLAIYDVLGREVAVLIDSQLAAGSHSVTFDASTLTSGVYVYKLEAGGKVQTKRMTLLK